MSYVTVYSEFYKPHPLYINKPFRPEQKMVELNNDWSDSTIKSLENKLDNRRREKIMKTTGKIIWGTSTYQADYCDSLRSISEDLKINSDSIEIGNHKNIGTKFSRVGEPENELMKAMKTVFERNPLRSIRQPLNTHRRIMGYCRPSNYQCGLSVYQHDISKPGYICMRDHLIKPVVKENGYLPKNVVTPIFSVPDGERLMF